MMTAPVDPYVRAYLVRWLEKARAEAARRAPRAVSDPLRGKPIERWWFHVLANGEFGTLKLVHGEFIPKQLVRQSYEEYTREIPEAQPWHIAAKRLRQLVRPGEIIETRRLRRSTKSGGGSECFYQREWNFPPLREMRESFQANTGVEVAGVAETESLEPASI